MTVIKEIESKKGPCWTGYHHTPGKKEFSPGSCEKNADTEDVELNGADHKSSKKDTDKRSAANESDAKHGHKKSPGDKKSEHGDEKSEHGDKKSEHGDKKSPFGGMPLIGGGGLLAILENVIPLLGALTGRDTEGEMNSHLMSPRDSAETPFDVLEDDDFDGDDPTVQQFQGDMGGVNGIVKIIKVHGPESIHHLAEITETLRATRSAYHLSTLRGVFGAVNAAMRGVNAGHNQADAVCALEKLALDSPEHKMALLSARDSVLAGTSSHLDAATFRVRGVFAAYLPNQSRIAGKDSVNERLAYTSLSTQGGEGYLLCPKAEHQIGRLIPMEISKCRDNCIDSRTARDGTVTCAYRQWLKVSADNQDALNARLDVQRHPDNASHLLTLEPGQRSHPEHDKADYDGFETRLESNKDRVGRSKSKVLQSSDSIETRLEKKDFSGALRRQNVPDSSRKSIQDTLEKKASSAKVKRVDPDEDETLGGQVDDKGNMPKNVPTNTIEQRLEGKGLYTNQGIPKQRPQDLNSKKASVKQIDSKSDDTLGEQVSKGNTNKVTDESIAQILARKEIGLSEAELDECYELLLSELRENED